MKITICDRCKRDETEVSIKSLVLDQVDVDLCVECYSALLAEALAELTSEKELEKTLYLLFKKLRPKKCDFCGENAEVVLDLQKGNSLMEVRLCQNCKLKFLETAAKELDPEGLEEKLLALLSGEEEEE